MRVGEEDMIRASPPCSLQIRKSLIQ